MQTHFIKEYVLSVGILVHPEKPVVKSVAVGKKFENHIRLDSLDDIRPALFVYIRESYELTQH